MTTEIMDFPSIIIAIFALLVSIGVFILSYRKGKHTEQIKIAMEISEKLDEAENKRFAIEDEIRESEERGNLSTRNVSALYTALKDAELLYMNHWEFYCFLVNKGHIDNDSLKEFFEDNLISGSDEIFEKYHEYITDKKKFKEIKKLRKAIGKEPKQKSND
jgi:hypothetical protein